ncbi:hypothetical protein [Corynebacterium pygosceleis]|uniref:Secreted protein n=1 Tax=Corynebacterium pygosceleis TaxID=2800406 RepID=A0A9Q4C6S2_9CORY|nr:hypothetical protein [Corynebacterium pygosceleis]MCK7636716.1 hypothetical protein [Corynebacterium pygosceleis]MCK7674202.1 hypothetical protein [Corynebacterium pygosceleis]MCL0120496.1 hypothetical protein [Corynebacterium pygosceleis]MCX7467469.1 hypothetical protein [Corynebacterium pygosceleis]
MRPLTRPFIPAAAAVVAVLTGCSPQGAVTDPAPPDAPTAEIPAEDGDRGTGAVPLEEYPVDGPTDGMYDEYVTRIGDHAVVDRRTIRIAGMTGTTRCFGVRPVVDETDTEVRLALVAGTLPGTDGPCTREARFAAVDVPLTRDLGDRKIVLLDELDPGELARNH